MCRKCLVPVSNKQIVKGKFEATEDIWIWTVDQLTPRIIVNFGRHDNDIVVI